MKRRNTIRLACGVFGVFLLVVTLQNGFNFTGPLWAWFGIGASVGLLWGAVTS